MRVYIIPSAKCISFSKVLFLWFSGSTGLVISHTHIMKTVAVLLICGMLVSYTIAQGMGGMGKFHFFFSFSKD